MRKLLTLTSVACVIAAGPAAPQPSRLAGQALHCSAIFAVFAETHADDAALARKFGRAVEIFGEVYAKESGASDAAAQRATLLEAFRAKLAEREAYLREDGVVCGAWAEGFLAQGEQWTYVPVYPKVIGAGVRASYEKIAADAFGRWGR